MEYKNNITCNYHNLHSYQNAKCGKGIMAPVFVGSPFLSCFKKDNIQPKNSNENQEVLSLSTKGKGQIYNFSGCCDNYRYLKDSYNPYKSFEFSNLMNIQKNSKK